MIQVKHLKKQDYTTTLWAGGKTTEILLYPEDGNYAQRDFQLRLSTATVELPESDFTPLPGIQRHLTLLDGAIAVEHDGKPPFNLVPFQIWEFDGGKATTSFGTCVDFNLMHTPLWTGKMIPLGEETQWKDETQTVFVLYGTQNNLEVRLTYDETSEEFLLNKEESLVLTNPEGEKFSLSIRQRHSEDAKPFALAAMGKYTPN